MRVRAYRSKEFKAIDEYVVDLIESAPEPEELDEDLKKDLTKGHARTMCNISYYDKNTKDWVYKAIPWNYVIDIKN